VAIGVPVLVVKVLPHHRPFLGPRRRCGGHCIRGNRLFVPQIYPIALPPSELLLYCLLQTQAQHKRKCAHKVRDRGSKLHHKKLTPVRRSTAPASSSRAGIIGDSRLQSLATGRCHRVSWQRHDATITFATNPFSHVFKFDWTLGPLPDSCS
jgi:hypothetical protein